jgi:hypothetical protein
MLYCADGKSIAMFDASQPLLLDRLDDLPVLQQDRRGVVPRVRMQRKGVANFEQRTVNAQNQHGSRVGNQSPRRHFDCEVRVECFVEGIPRDTGNNAAQSAALSSLSEKAPSFRHAILWKGVISSQFRQGAQDLIFELSP